VPGFDASTIVEPLDFDFTKFDGGSGVIPEPSESDVVEFYAEMDKLVKEVASGFVQLPDNPTAQDLVEALNLLTMHESYAPMLQGMTRIHAKFCKNSPTEEQLNKLPPRIRALFFQWIAQMMRPELAASDSKPVRRITRTVPGGSSTT
jgi:hypothetical protein